MVVVKGEFARVVDRPERRYQESKQPSLFRAEGQVKVRAKVNRVIMFVRRERQRAKWKEVND